MEIPKKLYSIAIIGSKSFLVPPWDPESIYTGLPGSEESVVYASGSLAKMGYKVDVYMDPPEGSIWSLPESNPRWFPIDLWYSKDYLASYDLVMMWRDIFAEKGKLRGKKVFYWPHDLPYQNFKDYTLEFDGICWLTESTKNFYEQLVSPNTIPYTICGNGYNPSQFELETSMVKKKNPYKLGYFSNYARGLSILLHLWPSIKAAYPKATLDIYYGRETWGTLPKNQMDQLLFRIKSLEAFGVTEKGKVGHVALAEAMKDISIWAYPCIYKETFCITAIKAQAAGCIPVTTSLAALCETVAPFAPQVPIILNQNDIEDYKNCLFETLSRVESKEVETERMQYISFAKQFTWDNCVKKWVDLYFSL
jgi:glycosyltransferase involved in cell wall biosynthesis